MFFIVPFAFSKKKLFFAVPFAFSEKKRKKQKTHVADATLEVALSTLAQDGKLRAILFLIMMIRLRTL